MDLCGELTAVFSHAKQFQFNSPRAHAGIGEVTREVSRVRFVIACWYQHLNRLSAQVVSLVTEQKLCLHIDEDDFAFSVYDHQRIGS